METYSTPLARFFRRRIHSQAEVDDLLQEVFYRLIRRQSDGNIENPQAYLFQIAANILRDRQRRAHTRQVYDHKTFDESQHAFEHISPERILQGKEQLSFLKAALMELPKKTQTIFILQRFEGMSYSEIATHQGFAVSTVEKHMMKAIKHITKRGR
tara:strand:- start:10338 stop:10805 length:468 start_codon:yes stop_codon:yes gene_type:complete